MQQQGHIEQELTSLANETDRLADVVRGTTLRVRLRQMAAEVRAMAARDMTRGGELPPASGERDPAPDYHLLA